MNFQNTKYIVAGHLLAGKAEGHKDLTYIVYLADLPELIDAIPINEINDTDIKNQQR